MNEIDSFTDLEKYLTDLKSLSQEIETVFTKTKNTFQKQQQGWASSNSKKEEEKMNEYLENAKMISTNIDKIRETVAGFKKRTQEEDAA